MFTACCTTRSRAKALCFSIALFAFASAGAFAQGSIDVDSNGADAAFLAVAKANAITGEGKPPFYLKLSFQIFKMYGSRGEAGTVEEWWAGPGRYRVEVTSPSLGTLVDPELGAVPDETGRRTLFLIRRLVNAVTDPAAYVSTDPRYVKLLDESRDVHGVKLDCVDSLRLKQKEPSPMDPIVCWQKDAGAIRLMGEQNETVVRNKLGRFAGTTVSIDTQVAYGSEEAISGHIEALNGINPSSAPLGLKKTGGTADPGGGSAESTIVPSLVLDGHLVNRVQPEYPMMARENQIQGTVVLAARITERGTISLLTPIASPDDILTNAAIAAVRRWTYTPYLLNGTPTAVDTTITVNFNLRP